MRIFHIHARHGSTCPAVRGFWHSGLGLARLFFMACQFHFNKRCMVFSLHRVAGWYGLSHHKKKIKYEALVLHVLQIFNCHSKTNNSRSTNHKGSKNVNPPPTYRCVITLLGHNRTLSNARHPPSSTSSMYTFLVASHPLTYMHTYMHAYFVGGLNRYTIYL